MSSFLGPKILSFHPVKLPWICNTFMQLREQIKRSVNNCFNSVKLRVVFKSNMLFPLNFKNSVTAPQKILLFTDVHADAVFTI